MRLATIRTQAGAQLFLERDGKLIEAASVAPAVAGIEDVGELLRSTGEAIQQLRDAHARGLGVATLGVDQVSTWASPILKPGKIIGIGLNYRKHAAEGGVEAPSSPIIFAKFANSVIGSGEPITHHDNTTELDYEVELAVVIGQRCSNVSEDKALEVVAGYMGANDVSARDLQHGLPGDQWVYGKTLDTFCPLGPFLVTRDEVPDWRAIQMRTWVNGDLRQDEFCGDMIFGIEQLVTYVSRGITLEPGDVILTGTPAGVGLGFKPPKWLMPGDMIEIELTGLGRLTSMVAAPLASAEVGR
jgi:2-keto-4-pentenoate hydratase/2-oxohepta-3-ene-1,7-dioic acid hydratase in catechol pathway